MLLPHFLCNWFILSNSSSDCTSIFIPTAELEKLKGTQTNERNVETESELVTFETKTSKCLT